MANLAYRRNSVQRTLGSVLAPAASYTVTAYAPGARVNGNQTGATITVDSGHGFPSGSTLDCIVVRAGAMVDGSFVTCAYASSTTVTLGSSLNVLDGDRIVNLGNDTGSTSPNYDGSTVAIYSDDAGADAISNETVTTSSTGEYEYWTSAYAVWELVRSGSKVHDLVVDAMGGRFVKYGDANAQVAISVTPFPSGAVAHGIEMNKLTTDTRSLTISFARGNTQRWAMGEDYYQGDRSYFVPVFSDLGISGTSGDISGVSWYGAETEAVHGGTGGTASPKWFWNGTPYNNYDSSWTHHFNGGSSGGRSAIFQHFANTGNNGGIDIYFAGAVNAIDLKQEDGSSYRSTIRFRRVTAAGGSTANADWLLGMGTVTGANTFSIYDQIATDTRYLINSSGSHIWSNANGTYTPTATFDFLSESSTTNSAVTSRYLRFKSTGTPAANLALYESYRLPDEAGTEYQAGAVGVVMTSATAGSPTANIQLWSSYATSAILTATSTRKVGINTTAPGEALSIVKDADNRAAIYLDDSTATPSNPVQDTDAVLYVKANKIVIAYNDAGTMRYKYLDLTGTGVTWTHTTSAP